MSIKKRKFDSIEKMLSFPKYITLDNDTLTLKNCIINFDFSLVNFISTISPQSIVCVSNEQKETEDTGKLYEVNCNITFENVDFLKDVSIIGLVFITSIYNRLLLNILYVINQKYGLNL